MCAQNSQFSDKRKKKYYGKENETQKYCGQKVLLILLESVAQGSF